MQVRLYSVKLQYCINMSSELLDVANAHSVVFYRISSLYASCRLECYLQHILHWSLIKCAIAI